MSKVLTFSRYFPDYHPKKGQPTYFAEKLWQSLFDLGLSYGKDASVLEKELETFSNPSHFIIPKYHTIRAGKRWKVGDKFSPRVWSGLPYRSKQIIIADDIEVKKVWDVIIDTGVEGWMDVWFDDIGGSAFDNEQLSKNDGLALKDFFYWFHNKKVICSQRFEGQVICWNENINY